MMPDEIAVARHALKKRVDGFEGQLFVQKALEVEFDHPPIIVERRFEVQQMRFTDPLRAAEGGLGSDADRRRDPGTVGKHGDTGIDPVTGQKTRTMVQIGGRISQRPPPLIPLDHRAADPMRPPQESAGLLAVQRVQ